MTNTQRQVWLPPSRLPGLDALVNGELWKRWSQDGKVFPADSVPDAISYMRLKPGVSCRLALFGEDPAVAYRVPLGFSLQLFPDAERARTAFQKVMSRNPRVSGGLYEPFVSETPPVVALPFPVDPTLRTLTDVFQSDRLRCALFELLPEFTEERWRIQRRHVQVQLFAFKPERRAVFRIRVKARKLRGDRKKRSRLILKVMAPDAAERSHRNLSVIGRAVAGNHSWGLPEPLGVTNGGTFVAVRWEVGEALSALAEGECGELAAHFRRTGRALAELHSVDVPLDHRPSPLEEADRLLGLAEDLVAVLPGEEARIRRLGEPLAAALARLSLSPSVIVHGDLHPGQVIVRGEHVTLIDLDAAGRGYAAMDLGSFLSRLDEVGAPSELGKQFVDGYREVTDEMPDLSLVELSIAVSHFQRALFPLRNLEPEWPARTLRLLDLSEEHLRESLR